jgi:hypothetical protein
MTADCTDLDISDVEDPKTKTLHKNLLLQIRPAFGGNIIATIVNYDQWPQMATVREGVMALREPDPDSPGRVYADAVRLIAAMQDLQVLGGGRPVRVGISQAPRSCERRQAKAASRTRSAIAFSSGVSVGAPMRGSASGCELTIRFMEPWR